MRKKYETDLTDEQWEVIAPLFVTRQKAGLIYADGGYRGSFVYEAYKYFGFRVEISKKLKPRGWQVLPKRWRVERTFAWLNHSRRLSKDYEQTVTSAQTLIKISHIHTLLKRL